MLKASKITNVSNKTSIRDGGNIVMACKVCESPLLVLWITRPEAKFDWVIKANCPYCGNETEKQEIHGMFHYGPYCVVTDEETQDNEGDLFIETFVENNGVVDVLMKRHKK